MEGFKKEQLQEREITELFTSSTIAAEIPEKYQLATIQKADGNEIFEKTSLMKDKTKYILENAKVIIRGKKKKKKRKKKKRNRKSKKRGRKDGKKTDETEPAKKKRKVESDLQLVSGDY